MSRFEHPDIVVQLKLRKRARDCYRKLRVPKLDNDAKEIGKRAREVGASPLHSVLTTGSFQERAVLRKQFATPQALARNQDLLLMTVREIASSPDGDAMNRYQALRLLLPENLPAWASSYWKSLARASWRTFNLHGKEMRKFCGKVRASVDQQFREWKIEAFDATNFVPKIGINDERVAFLTYAVGHAMLTEATIDAKETGSIYDRDTLIGMADYEIRESARTLSSPTMLGTFFRRVAAHELEILLKLNLLEDLTVALGIPLEDSTKKKLMKKWEKSMLSAKFAKHMLNLERYMNGPGSSLPHDQLLDNINKFAMKNVFLEKALAPVQTPRDETEDKKEDVREPVRHAESKTIEVSPSYKVDYSQIRLASINAALESAGWDEREVRKYGKQLLKLCFEDDDVVGKVVQSIEDGEKLDVLIDSLREKRRVQLFGKKTSSQDLSEQDTSLQRSIELFEEDVVVEKWEYRFSREALHELKDGSLRLQVEPLLRKYADTPELLALDKRKIKETTDCWELKDYNGNTRIYYFHAAPNLVVVLLAGKKRDQLQHIKRLEDIRNREMEQLKLEGFENLGS